MTKNELDQVHINNKKQEDDYTLKLTLEDPGERTETFNPLDYKYDQEVNAFLLASKTIYRLIWNIENLWGQVSEHLENNLDEYTLGELEYDYEQILELVSSAWNSYTNLHLLKDNPIPKHPDDLVPKDFDDPIRKIRVIKNYLGSN